MNHHGWSAASLGSIAASVLVNWGPYFQSLAALVAIIAGIISIYKSLKKKKKD